jgi:thiol-disulfide isomerase/thioredoxin
MKRLVLALAAVLMAASVAGGLWLIANREPPKSLPPPPVVDAAQLSALYATALPDLEGRSQALAQWRGKVLVINYWATWCPPCIDEMPMLSALHARYAARGVQFVGIAVDDGDKVREFSRRTPVAYPLLVGGAASARITAGLGNAVMAMPFSLVLDRDGRLRTAVLGRLDEGALSRLLDELTAP